MHNASFNRNIPYRHMFLSTRNLQRGAESWKEFFWKSDFRESPRIRDILE